MTGREFVSRRIKWCPVTQTYNGPVGNTIAHVLSLDVNANVNIEQTCIMATIGPSSSSLDTLKVMIRSGMRVARLNLSHGTQDVHSYLIRQIRRAERELQSDMYRPVVTIALDTQGPEVRTGVLKDNAKFIQLLEGDKVCLTFDEDYKISVHRPSKWSNKLLPVVRQGSQLFINDRIICLEVNSFYSSVIECTVKSPGLLGSQKEVIVPGWNMNELPDFNDQDLDDIKFAIESDADLLLLSNVRHIDMVVRAKKLIERSGIRLIAKIEREQSLAFLNELIAESDGLLLARGDLGVEVPLYKLFLIQKNIVARCNLAGKPIICSK